jgi:uncharacterized protein (UPF0335 family)
MNNIFSEAIEAIDTIFDFTLTNAANDYWRIDIGIIGSDFAAKIKENTAFDLENYTISIDTHCIRHILRQHGNENTERNRGQIPIHKKELRMLVKIINSSDVICDAGKSAIGNDCILIEKELKGKHYFSVWEIRTVTSIKKQNKKKSRIMLQTLYAH